MIVPSVRGQVGVGSMTVMGSSGALKRRTIKIVEVRLARAVMPRMMVMMVWGRVMAWLLFLLRFIITYVV